MNSYLVSVRSGGSSILANIDAPDVPAAIAAGRARFADFAGRDASRAFAQAEYLRPAVDRRQSTSREPKATNGADR